MKRRSVILSATAGALMAFGVLAGPASALTNGQELVSGTTTSTLSLGVGLGATFATNFTPGGTAAASGSVTATDTNATWTLSVADTNSAGLHQGHMLAATGATCTGSDAFLSNALNVTVTGTGATSSGQKAIGSGATAVATGTSPLSGVAMTTAYQQVIPSTETMLTGCVYTMTSTYTIQ